MPRPRRQERNGRLQCQSCSQWLPHNRFRRHEVSAHAYQGAIQGYHSKCKACEQTERDALKNQDRPRSLIEARAARQARKSKTTKEFMLDELNHEALIPIMRAMMGDDGRCIDCGHGFLNERDIQIEHRAPPRHPQDWARLHARNLSLSCASCNGSKGAKNYEQWLDEQESVRQSVAAYHAGTGVIQAPQDQLQLAI